MGRFREMYQSDDFEILMERQGWHLEDYKASFAAHPEVFNGEWFLNKFGYIPSFGRGVFANQGFSDTRFYDLIGDNTARKIMKAILQTNCTLEDLQKKCNNKGRLESILDRFGNLSLISNEGNLSTRGPGCSTVSDLGSTLEWYVCEWFGNKLKSPARYNVHVTDMPEGGDLDVVAFVNDIRVFIECKSGNPSNIGDEHLRRFLQRANDFLPEIAILLIDTQGKIDGVLERINTIVQDLQLKSITRTYQLPIAAVQTSHPTLLLQGGTKCVYWGLNKNVFVANVPQSIDASIRAVLRTYYSKIRHILIPGGGNEHWNYIKGIIDD